MVDFEDDEHVDQEQADEAEAEQATEKKKTVPFAFTKCKYVTAKGMSSYLAECLICGKKVTALSPHIPLHVLLAIVVADYVC